MPSTELRNTSIRIQQQGSADIRKIEVAEAVIQQVPVAGLSVRDPFRGVLRQRQTAWHWEIQTAMELGNTESRLLMIRSLGSTLEPDQEPPQFTIEATTPDGIHRRFAACKLVALTIIIEKRRIIGVEGRFVALAAAEENTPLVVNAEDSTYYIATTGIDVSVELDDVEVPSHRLQLTFERRDFQPANYQTNGEPIGFNGAGHWDCSVLADFPSSVDPTGVSLPETRRKLKVDFGYGDITIPVVYFIKPTQQIVADDFDDRELAGRAEFGTGVEFVELSF